MGVDKWTAMLVVVAAKFADPSLRAALLSTGRALLLEHNPEVRLRNDDSRLKTDDSLAIEK